MRARLDLAVKRGAAMNHIRAECLTRAGRLTRLRLTVNGREVAETIGGIRSFDAIGLVSSSTSIVPSRARFDNLVASRG